VQQWNKAKQAEYHDRVPYKVDGVAFANVAALKKEEEADGESTDDSK